MTDPSAIIAKRLFLLNTHSQCARLQATVVALAVLGAYSPPYDNEICSETLTGMVAVVESLVSFPLTTIDECLLVFSAAVNGYNKQHRKDESK